MTVIIGNDVPDAIRGHLKRWFIEPKPNVFIGTVNARTRENMLEFLLRWKSDEMGFLVIQSSPNCQGYDIERIGAAGNTGRSPINLSGIPLVIEKDFDYGSLPF